MADEPNPSPPSPVASPAESAQQFMRENYEAYRKNDPGVVAEVRRRFAQAHPGIESDGVYDDASVAKPAEKPAEPPKPPEKPAAPENQVPSSPDGYAFPIPAEIPPGLTNDQWARAWSLLRADAHAVGLTDKQADGWFSFAHVKALLPALEVGYDGLSLQSLVEAANQRLTDLGVPEAKRMVLPDKGLQLLEQVEPLPPVDASELEARQRELMLLPAYTDRFDPRHAATKAEIHRLAEEIVRKRPILLQD